MLALWRNGGATQNTCTNSLTVTRSVVESLLLKANSGRFVYGEGLEIFKPEFERCLIEQRTRQSPRQGSAEARLADARRLHPTTRYEIDKAREIVFGLVGEKKIVLHPTEDRLERYFTAEPAEDYAGLIPLVFQGKIKLVAVGRIERPTRGL